MFIVDKSTHFKVADMLGLGKTGLIAHASRFDFSPSTQNYMKKTTYFHNQNQLDLSGLLLLAAFPKPSGNPCMCCGAFNGALVSLGLAVCGKSCITTKKNISS